jgi:addiction module HigA family antidote
MVQTTQLRAIKKLSPGYFILEHLNLLNWTKKKLADLIRIDERDLDSILENQKPIDNEIANSLGKVFNTSSQYWMNLDTIYRSWLEKEGKT